MDLALVLESELEGRLADIEFPYVPRVRISSSSSRSYDVGIWICEVPVPSYSDLSSFFYFSYDFSKRLLNIAALRVDWDLAGMGFGKKLVGMAETVGMELGCSQSRVSSLGSFGRYWSSLGYTRIGEQLWEKELNV
ncbi:hypothetical protein H6501_05670 [Candidatus Woesearchaeota archaeon]|nr:hypothetical protein [Nanoarchaeota archaeon]MCB9371063.1 hypothetical protein [Candidatus Woesearchaeota archaeon]USN44220.1 MAG: hypothetical protein H6500_00020 [Candidatus Woesearchaeota archaeon]